MQDFYPALVKTFSSARLHAYHDGESNPLNLDVVARYAHNMDVSQKLTPALHIFEVSLRNNIYEAFKAQFSDPEWYDLPGLLGAKQQAQLASGRDKLRSASKLETADRLVAELTLGFWVGLFSNNYEHQLWRANPNLLAAIFPRAPRHVRNRGSMSKILNPVRDLRNRVAHWERVAHDPSLNSLKQDIDRVVGWLCPAARCLLDHRDSFNDALSPKTAAEARSRVGACFNFEEIQSL